MFVLPDCMDDALKLIGTGFVFYVAFRTVLLLCHLFYVYIIGWAPNFNKLGSWSVVTGATDGIGRSFARQLAKRGQNIVLISRSAEKLADVAGELKQKYNVDVKCIAADFSRSNIYERIADELADVDVGTLVNNVGLGYDHPEFFLELDDRSDAIDRMVAVNVMSAVRMTEIVLPRLVEKKRGAVLNVSSASALQPTPLFTLYSAAKQFVDCYSKALGAEYASRGIVVQSFMPYFVATKMSKIRRASLMVPSADTYAACALRTVGKAPRTYGYLPHALQALVYSALPECVYLRAAMLFNMQIRARALKKKALKQDKRD